MIAATLLSCHREGGRAVDVPSFPLKRGSGGEAPRHTITFILGSDHSMRNPYYRLAAQYYRANRDEGTDEVIEGLTSIAEVLEYLQLHADDTLPTLPEERGIGGESYQQAEPFGPFHYRPLHFKGPYGLISLVSHGNEFTDLQATVLPNGERVSAATLHEALATGRILPASPRVADSATTVCLHGCAVGQNQGLMNALAEVFGIRVRASRLFEYYAYLSPTRDPQSLRHYYARVWYAFYHPDSIHSEEALVQQLKQRYPHDTTDWHAGLRRTVPTSPADLYHYTFVVPCVWDEVLDDEQQMPPVNSRAQRQQWVAANADFRALLDSTRVPQQYFQIKFYRSRYRLSDGSRAPGLRVKARAGVVCLIQPILASDSIAGPLAPWHPSPNDTALFAIGR